MRAWEPLQLCLNLGPCAYWSRLETQLSHHTNGDDAVGASACVCAIMHVEEVAGHLTVTKGSGDVSPCFIYR